MNRIRAHGTGSIKPGYGSRIRIHKKSDGSGTLIFSHSMKNADTTSSLHECSTYIDTRTGLVPLPTWTLPTMQALFFFYTDRYNYMVSFPLLHGPSQRYHSSYYMDSCTEIAYSPHNTTIIQAPFHGSLQRCRLHSTYYMDSCSDTDTNFLS
jgi:hypothetical protein